MEFEPKPLPEMANCVVTELTTFHVVRDPKSHECAGDRVEKRLVLADLRLGSGAVACVLCVHVDCITAEAPRGHVFLNPHQASAYPHEL